MVKWLKSNWKIAAVVLFVVLVNGYVMATAPKEDTHAAEKTQSGQNIAHEAEGESHSEASSGDHGEAVEHTEDNEHVASAEHGEREESGLAAIEPGFALHLTIPFLFSKDPACDHEKLVFFKKFHHTKSCGVPNVVTVVWIMIIVLVVISKQGTKKLEQIPGRFQCVLEYLVDGVTALAEDMIGHHGRHYRVLLGSLVLYIFFSSLMGLVPGLTNPSANLSNNFALALSVFFFTHYAGFRHQGKDYLNHFIGPVMWLAPLMVPLHIVGELVRPVSLSLRLFGNMLGEEIVIMVLYALSPYVAPVIMMAFGIFAGLIQTAVFVLLSTIYIAGAVSHGE